MLKKTNIVIGTRGSQLALYQANWIKKEIIKKYPNLIIELIVIKTKGDKILDIPLAKIGGKGLFIKEIEEALLDKKIDLAVHSMKDMPADIPEGLCIGAFPKREDPRDALICREGLCLSNFSKGSKIGTSSLRRSAQLLHIKPDLEIVPIRGNLGTRIAKLKKHSLDAIVLAVAGLLRLGLEHSISQYLDTKIMLPAVGQGALCVEARDDDHEMNQILTQINHKETRVVILAERAFLARLEGGCQVPIAANGVLKDGNIVLTGLVSSLDGLTVIKETLIGPRNRAQQIGIELAELLLFLGADHILQEFI